MDIVSITGSSLLMRSAETQQALSAKLMKMAAEQQGQIASLIEQNVKQTSENLTKSSDKLFNFSTYA